jgi:hypothetical protein
VERDPEKNISRKTTGLGQAAKQVSSEQPMTFGLLDLLESTTKFIGHFIVISLTVVFVSSTGADMWSRRILIDPVIVPKAMEDQGYSGVAAANRIADEIDRMERSTQTNCT